METFINGERKTMLKFDDIGKKERWYLKYQKEKHVIDLVAYLN